MSLHVGSLVPLLVLARFQRAGHRTLVVVGEATGQIGDPSGKSNERGLQPASKARERAICLARQIGKFIDVTESTKGALVNNLEWIEPLGVLGFLRDTGKHFSVGALLNRDSIRSRLERSGEDISYAEFSYMLLQSLDFLTLFEKERCVLQIGGSDQWSNMCAGVDLIRLKHGATAFAVTLPLLTNKEGQKFGQSVTGVVSLDAEITSVWDFFQFWLNVRDTDVIKFLKMFTFLEQSEIEALAITTSQTPHLRVAQKRLAVAVTELVHGAAATRVCVDASSFLFCKDTWEQLTSNRCKALEGCLPFTLSDGAVSVGKILVKQGLEPSMARAQESFKRGAIQINGKPCLDANISFKEVPPLHGKWFLLQKGKQSFGLVALTSQPENPT